MKKLLFGGFIFSILLLSGCSLFNKKEDKTIGAGSGDLISGGLISTTGTMLVDSVKGTYKFEDQNCNKYVTLMECLLDKTPDAAKEQTAKSFVKVMELWQGLEKTALPETCKNTMNMLEDQKDVFAKAGCELK